MTEQLKHEIVLTGLDGSNPLAFLAALGTLRGLTKACPNDPPLMAWRQENGAWRPVLRGNMTSRDAVTNILSDQCRDTKGHPTLNIAENLTISRDEWREHILGLLCQSERHDATTFAAAFGCDAISNDTDIVADTALRTMSGAGHQHFLKTMRQILSSVNESHLYRSLFTAWDYADPLKSLSLRFDPLDDKRYAMQWNDPSGDPTRNKRGNMLGANALAILGIPLLKVAPVRGELKTTGFRGQKSHDCFWTWPIWTVFINCEVASSLLSMPILQSDLLDADRVELSQTGIAAVFRSQRITTGKFRNFTTSELA